MPVPRVEGLLLPGPARPGIGALRVLVAAGVCAAAYLAAWPFAVAPRRPLPFVLLFALTLLFVCVQVLPAWWIYLKARRPAPDPARPEGLTVDVYVAACGEPAALVERSLAAAVAMRGEHRTFLLDDSGSPDLSEVARRLGAGYLTREGNRNAKAGNLNAALPRTDGGVIAVFDIDHVPAPDFLERTVGHFADPGVGFVQAMLTYGNGDRRWVAHAAVETGLDFFNPVAIGMDAAGATPMMGSNSVIRRTALESIGGYRPGLAEDLATCLALHAAGWRSAYVAEPLAPGLAPEDVAAWFTQQLKWARGVFEVLFEQFPAAVGRLTAGQRIAYLARMTNYGVGAVTAAYLAVTCWVLLSGDRALAAAYSGLLAHAAPLAAVYLVARPLAIHLWRHPSVPTKPLWRAVALVYFTWPLYTLALLMALLRLPLAFRPTPKSGDGRIGFVWVAPQAAGSGLLLWGVAEALAGRGAAAGMPGLLAFAAVQAAPPLLVLAQRLRPERLRGLREEARERRAEPATATVGQ